MAKLEQTIRGDYNQILNRIESGIVNSSMSASLEDSSDFYSNGARCSVRVFERYSWLGSNRVSLSVTLFQCGDDAVHLSAITAGGSQALFLKSIHLAKKHFWINLESSFNCLKNESAEYKQRRGMY